MSEITAAEVWRQAIDAASESGIAFRPTADRRGIAVIEAALAQARAEALEEALRALSDHRLEVSRTRRPLTWHGVMDAISAIRTLSKGDK